MYVLNFLLSGKLQRRRPFPALVIELSEMEEIMFFELVRGLDSREVARYFILMLFLAMEGLIGLEQVEDDIKLSRVSVNEHGES